MGKSSVARKILIAVIPVKSKDGNCDATEIEAELFWQAKNGNPRYDGDQRGGYAVMVIPAAVKDMGTHTLRTVGAFTGYRLFVEEATRFNAKKLNSEELKAKAIGKVSLAVNEILEKKGLELDDSRTVEVVNGQARWAKS